MYTQLKKFISVIVSLNHSYVAKENSKDSINKAATTLGSIEGLICRGSSIEAIS